MSDPILVVEDNDDLLLLFKLVLESAGYRVETASSGSEALESVGKIQPQLVLLDIMMPGINGLQVARNIKQQQNYESLPILLVSAIDRLREDRLHDSQADGILYKPFDLDDLIFRVGQLTNTAEKKYEVATQYA
ncbi:MAG: response regulator [Pleurocapsa sp. MO_226.B13]|nr:response regulator [Pleurocapsa sp. MO_226.B13]